MWVWVWKLGPLQEQSVFVVPNHWTISRLRFRLAVNNLRNRCYWRSHALSVHGDIFLCPSLWHQHMQSNWLCTHYRNLKWPCTFLFVCSYIDGTVIKKKDQKDIVYLLWLCLLLWLTDWLIDWFVEVPQIKLRSLSVLGKCSTTQLHPSLSIKYINIMVIIITAETRPLVFACGGHIYIDVSKLSNL